MFIEYCKFFILSLLKEYFMYSPFFMLLKILNNIIYWVHFQCYDSNDLGIVFLVILMQRLNSRNVKTKYYRNLVTTFISVFTSGSE